jgi:hypothetical protein
MTTAKEQGELDLSRSAQSRFVRVHPHDTGFAGADISVTVRQARIEEERPAGAEQIGAAIDVPAPPPDRRTLQCTISQMGAARAINCGCPRARLSLPVLC